MKQQVVNANPAAETNLEVKAAELYITPAAEITPENTFVDKQFSLTTPPPLSW